MSLLLWDRPSRILNQRFGLTLEPEDFLSPLIPQDINCYFRPWRSLSSQYDSGSTVSFEKDKFQANLDVQQFKPEEITVKVVDNTVTIEGKHEEKQDEHGYISRQFVRRYVLPKGHDMNRLESKLSSDGVLTITAPRIDDGGKDCKTIPIIQTGQPSRPIENKNDNAESEK